MSLSPYPAVTAGLLAQKWAYHMGAKRVIAVDYVGYRLKLIKEKRFDATDIITHKLGLEKGEYAYETFDEKKDDCIKVVLKS